MPLTLTTIVRSMAAPMQVFTPMLQAQRVPRLRKPSQLMRMLLLTWLSKKWTRYSSLRQDHKTRLGTDNNNIVEDVEETTQPLNACWNLKILTQTCLELINSVTLNKSGPTMRLGSSITKYASRESKELPNNQGLYKLNKPTLEEWPILTHNPWLREHNWC